MRALSKKNKGYFQAIIELLILRDRRHRKS